MKIGNKGNYKEGSENLKRTAPPPPPIKKTITEHTMIEEIVLFPHEAEIVLDILTRVCLEDIETAKICEGLLNSISEQIQEYDNQ